jgi:hypothetical protein
VRQGGETDEEEISKEQKKKPVAKPSLMPHRVPYCHQGSTPDLSSKKPASNGLRISLE